MRKDSKTNADSKINQIQKREEIKNAGLRYQFMQSQKWI